MSIAPRETKCLSSCHGAPGAVAVGAVGEDPLRRLDRRRVAERDSARAGAGGGGRLACSTTCGAGRDDLRDHVAGAHHDHLLALAQVLADEVLLVVEGGELDRDAADGDGLRAPRRGAGRRTCRRSTSPARASSRRWSAGTSRRPPSAGRARPRPGAAAGRGRRPSPPRRRSRSRARRGGAPIRGTGRSPRPRLSSVRIPGLTRKPCSRSHRQRLLSGSRSPDPR